MMSQCQATTPANTVTLNSESVFGTHTAWGTKRKGLVEKTLIGRLFWSKLKQIRKSFKKWRKVWWG